MILQTNHVSQNAFMESPLPKAVVCAGMALKEVMKVKQDQEDAILIHRAQWP